jgi:hypothetical protein
MVAARYAQWGEDFVNFLVYWAGSAVFMAVLGVVFLVTGHLWWFLLALGGVVFSLLAIAAAVKHGKGTPRNIWRVLIRS